MTKKQYTEFFEKLEGEEGCDFREDADGKVTWKCRHDYALSHKILADMNIPIPDQNKFLDYCYEKGGHCDCEIIFNAMDHIL